MNGFRLFLMIMLWLKSHEQTWICGSDLFLSVFQKIPGDMEQPVVMFELRFVDSLGGNYKSPVTHLQQVKYH